MHTFLSYHSTISAFQKHFCWSDLCKHIYLCDNSLNGWLTLKVLNHTIIRAAFVCVCVCVFVPYLLRGPLTDLRQTWWVYVGGPPICPWGVLFRKGQWVDGSTGHFHFPLYYICASLTLHSCNGAFCFAATTAESNSAPFAALHLNGVCRWTSQLPLRGSFSKRSTGRRVNGSNGSTGHFHLHYIIYDSRRRQAHATLLQKAHGV